MPSKFYFDVESVGNLEPDNVVQQAIKVIQQKLAAVIQELEGDSSRDAGDVGGGGGGDGGARSPLMGESGYGEGFTTPFIGAGGQSAWGGGATPYGATPYGQNGWMA